MISAAFWGESSTLGDGVELHALGYATMAIGLYLAVRHIICSMKLRGRGIHLLFSGLALTVVVEVALGLFVAQTTGDDVTRVAAQLRGVSAVLVWTLLFWFLVSLARWRLSKWLWVANVLPAGLVVFYVFHPFGIFQVANVGSDTSAVGLVGRLLWTVFVGAILAFGIACLVRFWPRGSWRDRGATMAVLALFTVIGGLHVSGGDSTHGISRLLEWGCLLAFLVVAGECLVGRRYADSPYLLDEVTVASSSSANAPIFCGQRYCRIVENLAASFLYQHDRHGFFTYLSPSIRKVLGYSPEWFSGGFDDLLTDHPLNDHFRQYMDATLAGEENGPSEAELLAKDGRRLWFDISQSPVRDDVGNIIGVEGIAHDITQRKQISDERERLIAILDSAVDFVGTARTDGTVIYLNEGAQRLLAGDSEDRPQRRSLIDMHPRWVIDLYFSEAFSYAIEHGVWQGEAALLRDNGEEIPVSQAIMAHYAADGNLEYYSTIMRDISEQKQAENELKESEERFRATFEQAAVGIAHVALDGTWLRVNQRLCDIVGYSEEELLRKNFQDITHPDDLGADLKFVHRMLAGEIDHCTMRKRYIRKDGRIVWIELAVSLVHEPSGDPKYFISVVEDIDSQVEAETALIKAKQVSQEYIDSLPGLFYVVSRDARFVTWNKAWYSITGYNDEEIRAMRDADLFEGDEKRIILEWLHKVFEEGAAEAEAHIIMKDGRRVAHYLTGLRCNIDGTEYLVGLAIDISVRVKAESERAELASQLREAQKMEAIGQLAGGVAHDFNNLLQSILGYGEMARRLVETNSSACDFVDRIMQAGNRAKVLVGQLLAFSRRQVLAMEPVDLNDVVSDHVAQLDRIVGEKVSIEVDRGCALGVILGDRNQLAQILANVCLNARDAMPSGGAIVIKTENVEIDKAFCDLHSWATTGRFVRLSITDNGRGMNEQTLSRIFEPFFTTKPFGVGAGLGLSTVYGLVKQHNGFVFVDSEPGKGTSVEIYLPTIKSEMNALGADGAPLS